MLSGIMADSSSVQQNGLITSRISSAGAQSHQPPQAPTGPWSTYARILDGQRRRPATVANQNRENTGPGPQPLRGIPGFPTQPQPPNRNAPLGANRLPNGKLGTLRMFSNKPRAVIGR